MPQAWENQNKLIGQFTQYCFIGSISILLCGLFFCVDDSLMLEKIFWNHLHIVFMNTSLDLFLKTAISLKQNLHGEINLF